MQPNDFVSFKNLVEHTGLHKEYQTVDDVPKYDVHFCLEKDLGRMTVDDLKEAFQLNDLYIVSNQADWPLAEGFSAATCQNLEIDLAAVRDFQGGSAPRLLFL
jgi:hypothetical protein